MTDQENALLAAMKADAAHARKADKQRELFILPEVRACAHCRHEFQTTDPTKKYCGIECRKAATAARVARKGKVFIYCRHCGVRCERMGTRQIYCRACGSKKASRR
jgi:hypothetical protein